MTVLRVLHNTTYQYRHAVELGEHRLMSRPRDSHDLRLIDTTLRIDPPASSIRWIHDVFGNSIALALFDRPTDRLIVESGFRAEHYPVPPQELDLDAYATRLPFSYPAAEALDLGPTKERHYPDPDHKIDAWARAIVNRSDEAGTLAVLVAMTGAIKEHFRYAAREAAGVQSPIETLQVASGSCRDFAVFMMEAVRSLGMAARFVSGYLYDQNLVDAAGGLVGGGATHAWLQVYLPGAGWVEFDPTNALVGGTNLIRVAVARDASQAAPLAGTFKGASNDQLSMMVSVKVTTE